MTQPQEIAQRDSATALAHGQPQYKALEDAWRPRILMTTIRTRYRSSPRKDSGDENSLQ